MVRRFAHAELWRRWGPNMVRSFHCVFSLVALSCAISAADWPQYGGADKRNMVSDEKNLPGFFDPGTLKKLPNGEIDLAFTKNVKWVVKLGSRAYGNPTVSGGKVYVGTDRA